MYTVQDNLNNLGTSVTTVLGGDANLAANGTVTTTNIGGTGESTVHDAIKNNAQRITTNEGNIAANTAYIKAVEAKLPEVQAGENTTVDVTVDANGKATYTVSSKDFQPAIDKVDAKAEANAKSIEANKAAIAENAEGVKANTAEIKEVAKEAKRHSVVKAGKNTTVTKSFGENGLYCRC